MTQSNPTNKQRDRFIQLLRELFQLNQPDLDFGLYRIMHAKSDEIEKFLTEDLLAVIDKTFGGSAQSSVDSARAGYEAELATAKDYGAADPETSPKVQQARAAYENARDSAGDDAEIYDHLYRFFERYYDQGDFLSRRYYARETSDRAAPYSVPYDGSEVYLHWANKDQYYIKTTESFNHYSIDLGKAIEGAKQAALFNDASVAIPRKMHFKLVEAEEGEHNNVKAAPDKDRFFILDTTPIAWQTGESGIELVIRFHYRADDEKTGTAGTWRDKRNALSAETVLAALKSLSQSGDAYANDAASFHLALAQPVDKGAKKAIGKQETQTRLARYLQQYTAKNTMDYFIHKDLGGFLRRELDFYIKNEVMHIDDLGTVAEPHVANYEKYLTKLHTLRTVAHKLITFLAQIEDFQKKLWLKKKFVIDTQWLVTLDKVPAALHPEIVTNIAQWDEWEALGFLNVSVRETLKGSASAAIDYLQKNVKLVLDTHFFDEAFKDKLLAGIENIDDEIDGVLVHSENFQALNLIKYRYRNCINFCYIDPPYNTDHSKINYKNQFEHSSWLSLISNTFPLTRSLFNKNYSFGFAIDDFEYNNAFHCIKSYFRDCDVSTIVINHHPQGSGGRLSRTHEYYIVASPLGAPAYLGRPKNDESEDRSFMRSGTAENNYRAPRGDGVGRWRSFYALLVDPKKRKIVGAEPPPPLNTDYPLDPTEDGLQRIYPINSSGEERVWRSSYETGKVRVEKGELQITARGAVKQIIDHQSKRETIFSNWIGSDYNAGTNGTAILDNLGLGGKFDYPKSVKTLEQSFWMQSFGNTQFLVLDYFAGSGTSGHATINLNREDDGDRKYILVEQGAYFNTVLKPRIKKSVYSGAWKNGEPTSLDGIPQLVKVIRLESYEDTLNNLKVTTAAQRHHTANTYHQLREEYFLKYLLAFETKGSPSLLNINSFADPTAYQLSVKCAGSDAQEITTVDLIETFNWLIGIRVDKLHAPQMFCANFANEVDADLPDGSATRLLVKDKLKEVTASIDNSTPTWWFRSIEGRTPTTTESLIEQRVLILWRKLSSDLERDNAVLESYLREILRLDLSTSEDKNQFDIIYVNGSHNLPKLPHCDVRLLEETFHQRMWEAQDV